MTKEKHNKLVLWMAEITSGSFIILISLFLVTELFSIPLSLSRAIGQVSFVVLLASLVGLTLTTYGGAIVLFLKGEK